MYTTGGVTVTCMIMIEVMIMMEMYLVLYNFIGGVDGVGGVEFFTFCCVIIKVVFSVPAAGHLTAQLACRQYYTNGTIIGCFK